MNGYWRYKWRNVTHDDPTTIDAGGTNATAEGVTFFYFFPRLFLHCILSHSFQKPAPQAEKLSHLQLEWNSYLSIASMIPNVTFLLLNAVFGHRYSNLCTISLPVIMKADVIFFSRVDALINVRSSNYPEPFFFASTIEID